MTAGANSKFRHFEGSSLRRPAEPCRCGGANECNVTDENGRVTMVTGDYGDYGDAMDGHASLAYLLLDFRLRSVVLTTRV
jgi:hypothetical protein